jgi:basic amino acid/polyamine antiporter, APA family
VADGGFRKELGFFDATMVVVGIMVGSAIFLASSDMLRDVGAPVLLLAAWLVTGAMTLCGALSYAELAAALPSAGGQYVYLREAYGRLGGFLYGWVLLVVIQTGSIAAIAVGFAKYFGELAPRLGTGHVLLSVPWKVHLTLPLPWLAKPLCLLSREEFSISAGQLLACALILGLTWVHGRGLRYGKWLQNSFTVAKVVALCGLIVAGIVAATQRPLLGENLAISASAITATPRFQEVRQLFGGHGWPLLGGLMVFGGATVGALFAADGWNYLTFVAGEVKEPQRTLPRAIIAGTLAVTVLYLLVNLTYVASLPARGDPGGHTPLERGIAFAADDRVASAVVSLLAPGGGGTVMTVAVLVAVFGCLSGTIMAGPRVFYAMAQDRLFFAGAGKLNRQGVPAVALWVLTAWSILLVFSGTFAELLDFVVFALVLFYFLTILGLILLRRRRPDLPRPYRVPGYPLVPGFYLVAAGFILVSLLVSKPSFTWPGLIITALGIPVYFAWETARRSRGRPTAAPDEDRTRASQSG